MVNTSTCLEGGAPPNAVGTEAPELRILQMIAPWTSSSVSSTTLFIIQQCKCKCFLSPVTSSSKCLNGPSDLQASQMEVVGNMGPRYL